MLTEELVMAFVPLLMLWLGSSGVLMVCYLCLAAYRKKCAPDFGAVEYWGAGAMLCYVVQQYPGIPVFSSLLMFLAGFFGFCAGLLSAAEFRAAKSPVGVGGAA